MPLQPSSDRYAGGLEERWAAGRASLAPGRIELSGGHRLAYVVAGTDGDVCVLLHGIANTWRFWTGIAAELAATRRVVAFDLPGFGDSELPAGPLTAPAVADILIEAFDRLGIDQAAVCGHSMGGLVALAMAAGHPTRVHHVAVVGGALLGVLGLYEGVGTVVRHPIRTARLASVVAQGAVPTPGWILDRIAGSAALRTLFLSTYLRWPARLPAGPIRDCLVGVGRPGVLRAAAKAGSFDLAATASRVRCPVLVVNGDCDRLSPVAEAQQLGSVLSDARVVVIDGAGHWPMVERPAEVGQVIADFLAHRAG